MIQFFTVSEAVYKEYDQLKNQYDLDTSTMQKAMERASLVIIFLFLTILFLTMKVVQFFTVMSVYT